MARPIRRRDLVFDQRVDGFRVGHTQQRLGQAHQRDALVGGQAVFRQKDLHQPRRGLGADGADQNGAGGGDGGAVGLAQIGGGAQAGNGLGFVLVLGGVDGVELGHERGPSVKGRCVAPVGGHGAVPLYRANDGTIDFLCVRCGRMDRI